MFPKRLKSIKFFILSILTLLLVISNINAETRNKLPFIGSIVNLLNLDFYFSSGNNEIDAHIPNVKWNEEIDKILNEEINNYTIKIIEEFFNEYNELNHHYTKIDYEVITDNDLWFTLRISVLEEMASSNNYYKYYHINKKTKKIVNLSDLFKDKKYIKTISDYIKKEMERKMEKSENITYWVEKFTSISTNQSFYFNKKGELTIVFNSYEVAPGFMGLQEFVIPTYIYQDYLF